MRRKLEIEERNFEINSSELEEVITRVPRWIVRWGITVVFSVIMFILLLSAIIQYPEVIITSLKVNSLNAPKSVIAPDNAKLEVLLVNNGEKVKKNQILAYFETTANAKQVIDLLDVLKKHQQNISYFDSFDNLIQFSQVNLGELQGEFQHFYQEFILFRATIQRGYYLSSKAYLQKDLKGLKLLKKQILKQKEIQQLSFKNAETEYNAYKKLFDSKVISHSEFLQQENKFLSSNYPLQQSEIEILNNSNAYNFKEKEMFEIDHLIVEQRAKFLLALNTFISDADAWVLKHVLRAPVSGKIAFAGIIQQYQNFVANQEIFVIDPGNSSFFGEIQIPQYNMGKVRLGQKILVKLNSYPFEQYGMIRGELVYMSDVALKDSIFVAKVSFDHFEDKDKSGKIILKNGMKGEAGIITEQSTLLKRFFRSIKKLLNRS